MYLGGEISCRFPGLLVFTRTVPAGMSCASVQPTARRTKSVTSLICARHSMGKGCECVGYQAHAVQCHEHPNATVVCPYSSALGRRADDTL
jgi:hypothetical protein